MCVFSFLLGLSWLGREYGINRLQWSRRGREDETGRTKQKLLPEAESRRGQNESVTRCQHRDWTLTESAKSCTNLGLPLSGHLITVITSVIAN